MNPTIDSAIQKARVTQAELNAFTYIENVDEIPQSGKGALAGLPVGLKDIVDQAGRTTTCGSAFYRRMPDRSAPVVDRLEQAGARIIGRTGLHEFAFGFSSENPHFGPVRNPWDTSTSPGGSSGGSGAAVAAGIVPVAIGTDTGGSIRVPAALCGCYGLKVTYGRIPLEGVFPLVPSIDTVGPLAASIPLLESSYRAMSRDTTPTPEPSPLRLGIPQPWLDLAPMSRQVDRSFRTVVDQLRELGHEVHPIEMPDVVPARPLGYAIAAGVVPIHHEFRMDGKPYGDDVAERLDAAEAVTEQEIGEGMAWQHMIRARFDDAFAVVDFLITPTVPNMRKIIGEDTIDGAEYRKVLSWFTAIVNHALVPAIALPLSGTGQPPVSLQIIGPRHSDTALLALSRSLEGSGVVGFGPAR